jgi:hypothetical protein
VSVSVTNNIDKSRVSSGKRKRKSNRDFSSTTMSVASSAPTQQLQASTSSTSQPKTERLAKPLIKKTKRETVKSADSKQKAADTEISIKNIRESRSKHLSLKPTKAVEPKSTSALSTRHSKATTSIPNAKSKTISIAIPLTTTSKKAGIQLGN